MKKITTGGYKLDVMTEKHFPPCRGKEMPSYICLYLEVPIMAFFFSLVIPHKYLLQKELGYHRKYMSWNIRQSFFCLQIPFPSSLSICTFICMSAHIFYYPFKICDPLMFHLCTCSHTEASVRPRHFQNYSMIFCMELLRIEPII